MEIYIDQRQLRKHRRAFRIKLYFGFFLFALACFAGFYVVVYSPVFRIRNFEIIGAERFSKEGVLNILQPRILNNKLRNFLGQENLFAWGGGDADVSNTALLKANVNRDWLRQSVVITVKERVQFAIWCGKAGMCYWIDYSGVPFEEAPRTEGSLILIVYDSQEAAVLGREVVENRFIPNLVAVLEGVAELRLPVKEIVFDRKLQEVRVETYSGPDIIFSIRFAPALNLVSLQSLREKVGLKGIKYIDLRVENKLFYKNL